MTLNFVVLMFLFVSAYFQEVCVANSKLINDDYQTNQHISRRHIESNRNGRNDQFWTHSYYGNGVNGIGKSEQNLFSIPY